MRLRLKGSMLYLGLVLLVVLTAAAIVFLRSYSVRPFGGWRSVVSDLLIEFRVQHLVVRGEKAIYAGYINDAAVNAFRSKDLSAVKVLHIKSTGGLAQNAVALGEIVQNNKMDVIVHDYCLSGCAQFVLVAGQRRKIEKGAAVGCHNNPIGAAEIEQYGFGKGLSMFELDTLRRARSIYNARGVDETFALNCYSKIDVGCVAFLDGEGKFKAFKSAWFPLEADFQRFGMTGITGAPVNREGLSESYPFRVAGWNLEHQAIGDAEDADTSKKVLRAIPLCPRIGDEASHPLTAQPKRGP